MSKRRLTLKTESPNIAWFPFYPQEHKTHNNVSLVMEHLSLLSYIFIALFRDTPLATIGRTWPDGHMAINGYFGHIWPFMAIWPSGHGRSIVAGGVSLKRAIKM